MTTATRTTWSEDQVLDYVWCMAREGDVDRIALLRQVADVRIPRPHGWDREAIRREMSLVTAMLRAEMCFGCQNADRGLDWHHVLLQVQHGGSNAARNLVPLCRRCHRAVHPWMDDTAPRRTAGWFSVAAWARFVIDDLARRFGKAPR